MSHANAVLTPRTRLRLARLIVDDRWTYAAAAAMFMVSPRTAKKWADRYRTEGCGGMTDRSSRPRSSPCRTRPALVRRIVALRWRLRLGPVQIAGSGLELIRVLHWHERVSFFQSPCLYYSRGDPNTKSGSNTRSGSMKRRVAQSLTAAPCPALPATASG